MTNTHLLESSVWDKSVLDGNDLLDQIDELDSEFVEIYIKSLDFAGLMLHRDEYDLVKTGYFNFANYVGYGSPDGDIKDITGLHDELWAGYHPIPLLFSRLKWYGEKAAFHYTDTDSPKISAALKSDLETAKSFHDWLPSNWVALSETGGKGVFGGVLQVAEARYALDTGSTLTINQIVVLSGLNIRSVKNALSKNDETGLAASVDGMITHQEAIRWLKQRRNFEFTKVYRPNETADAKPESNIVEEKNKEYVFVPVTDDGCAFLPELRRTNGYQIGKYGEEVYIDDYFEALKKLSSMGTPRWRRPNENGKWGIKVGSGCWKRFDINDIKRSLQTISN